jgi:ribosomal protein S18 acetylase RimI-like enzyme
VTPSATEVRRLRVDDAEAFMCLRREALEAHPLAFAASAEDDVGLDSDFVRRSLASPDDQAVFGSFEDGQLRGVVGLVRSSKLKQCHLATIWGMYVSAGARSRAAGRALLDAAVAQARAWGVEQVQLGVTDAAPEAKRMYEAAGFETWGRQPRTLQWQGRFVDESHMALDLREPGGHR